MSRKTPVSKIVVDSLFPIPKGSEDQLFYEEDFELLYDDTQIEEVESEFSIDYDDGYDDKETSGLDIPNDFYIVSQTIRRAPGGQQVVDVVIESEDIPGAIKYEIQVTKI